jgi:hypothetical protein
MLRRGRHATSDEKKDRGYRAPSFLRIFRRQFTALFAFALPLGHKYVHRPSAFQRAAWSPIRPDDWRQSAPSILCAQLARHPTECAFRAGNKDRRLFRAIAPLIPFHTPSNRRTEFTSSVAEVARRFAGSPRLSQIAQRVARER